MAALRGALDPYRANPESGAPAEVVLVTEVEAGFLDRRLRIHRSSSPRLSARDDGYGAWSVPPSAVAREFPAVTASLAAVRAWIGEQACCRGWRPDRDVIELLVTELTANVVTHTCSRSLVVRLQSREGLEVAVYDTSADLPVRCHPSPWEEAGRGLALLDALAQAWGVRPVPDGKWVWFRLPHPYRRAVHFSPS